MKQERINKGLAKMFKGGCIMDVTNDKQAKIAEELNEEPKGNQMLQIPTEKLSQLIKIIEKNGLFKNARIENELLKIVLKGNNEVLVDSDNSRIRRLDRLCKQFDGECKDN